MTDPNAVEAQTPSPEQRIQDAADFMTANGISAVFVDGPENDSNGLK